MAAKPETSFIKSVHNHLKEVYFEKMNNPFRSGCADVWYSGDKGDLWVEYKYEPSLPKIKVLVPGLSPRQVKWLKDRYDEGRNVAVIVGFPEGGVIYTNRTWEYGLSPRDVASRVLTRPALAGWIQEQVGKSPCKSSERSSRPRQR